MFMSWPALLNDETAVKAGTALVSSASLTDISATPNYVLPANFCHDGSSFEFAAHGVFSNTATPTLLLGIYWGGIAGTALITTGAVTTQSGVTNVPWRIYGYIGIRSKGSSGSAWAQGEARYGTSVSAYAGALPMPNTANATVTIDTTTDKAITVGAQWGTSSASNTVTCHGFYFKSLGL